MDFSHFCGMKGTLSVVLLAISNVFMTFAWYGHLNWKNYAWFQKLGLFSIILLSWGLAFFEYIFQVPANRMGFSGNGGPFSQVELKTIQEFLSLTVFALMSTLVFKSEKLAWNHFLGFGLMVLAVFVVFKKW
jgi:uncharacterized protein (DUF486 family)